MTKRCLEVGEYLRGKIWGFEVREWEGKKNNNSSLMFINIVFILSWVEGKKVKELLCFEKWFITKQRFSLEILYLLTIILLLLHLYNWKLIIIHGQMFVLGKILLKFSFFYWGRREKTKSVNVRIVHRSSFPGSMKDTALGHCPRIVNLKSFSFSFKMT